MAVRGTAAEVRGAVLAAKANVCGLTKVLIKSFILWLNLNPSKTTPLPLIFGRIGFYCL